eukprot:TRINITY_DN16533_c0_g1_i1.p1 TRINITY_DN16533_c0_g1~~TRINITY_DN16533_c0_g1_i1.p1  ORF type:complete len:1213 (+),score=360.75 TRINITY_DN16533_c0_g1_i1:80-3640(+)
MSRHDDGSPWLAAGVVHSASPHGVKKYKAELKAIQQRSRHGSEQRARQELGKRELEAKLATREQDVLYAVGLGQAILDDLTRLKRELAAAQQQQAAAYLAPLHRRFSTAAENFFALAEDAIEAKAAVLSAAALDSFQRDREGQDATTAALSQQLRQLQDEIEALERDRETRTELDSGELYKVAAEAAKLRAEVTTCRRLLEEKDAAQHAADAALRRCEGDLAAARRREDDLEAQLAAQAADGELDSLRAEVRSLQIGKGRLEAELATCRGAAAARISPPRVAVAGDLSAAWDAERAGLQRRIDSLAADLSDIRADNARLLQDVIPMKDDALAAANTALDAARAAAAEASERPQTPAQSRSSASPHGESPVLALKDEVKVLRRRLRDVLGDTSIGPASASPPRGAGDNGASAARLREICAAAHPTLRPSGGAADAVDAVEALVRRAGETAEARSALEAELSDCEERCVSLGGQVDLKAQEVAAYRGKVASLRDDLADVRRDRKRLAEKHDAAAQRAKAAQEGAAAAQAEANDLRRRLDAVRHADRESRAEASQLQQVLRRLSEPGATARVSEATVAALQEEVGRLMRERQRVLEQMREEAVDGASSPRVPPASDAARELARDLRAAKAQIATLRVFVETEARTNEVLRADAAAEKETLLSEKRAAEQRAAACDTEVVALKEAVQERTARLERAEAALRQVEGAGEQERARAEEQNTQHSSEVALLKAAEQAAAGERDLVKDQLANTERLCDVYRKERTAHETEIASAAAQLDGLRTDNASLRKELAAVSASAKLAAAEARDAAARKGEEAAAAATLREANRLLEERNAECERRARDAEGALAAERASGGDVKAAMAALQRSVDESRVDARQHEQELKALISERREWTAVPVPPTPVPPTPVGGDPETDEVQLALLRAQVIDLRADRAELQRELGRAPTGGVEEADVAAMPAAALKADLARLRDQNLELRRSLAAETTTVSEDSVVHEPYGTDEDDEDDGPLLPRGVAPQPTPAALLRGAFWDMVGGSTPARGISPARPSPRRELMLHSQAATSPRVELVSGGADDVLLDIVEEPVVGEHAETLQMVFRDVHRAREEIQTMTRLSLSPHRARSASPVLIIDEEDGDGLPPGIRSPVTKAMLQEQRRHQQAREANMRRVTDALSWTLETGAVYRHSSAAAAYAVQKNRV